MTTQDISQIRQSQGFRPKESRGLFVGVNTFHDEEIPDLQFAVDDAVDLAFLFSYELELIPPTRVHLALSGQTQKPETADRLEWLLAEGAVRGGARSTELYRLVHDLAQKTGPGGVWILTASTHGFADQGRNFFAASDSWSRRLEKTGISLEALLDDSTGATAPRRLLLLDTCRGRLSRGTRGDLDEEGMSESFAQAITSASGLALLNSTTLGGYSYEHESIGNGVFTSAVIRGLRGHSPSDGKGFITVETLARYVNQEIVDWVQKNKREHVRVSRGITSTIEGLGGSLPLASAAPEDISRREDRRLRDLALRRLQRNIGRYITGKHYDEIESRTRGERLDPEAMALINEADSLDGTERAQRAFLYFYEQQKTAGWRNPFREGLGLMYGIGRAVDELAAQKSFLTAAESGSAIPRVWMARLRNEGVCRFERDVNAARTVKRQDFEEVRACALRGDSDAALVLGFALLDGLGCEVDTAQAVTFLKQAADAGDSVAMNCLGFLAGEGGDQQEELRWFQRAVEAGNVRAMTNLAESYRYGRSVEKDEKRALELYQRAAEHGYPLAMNILGTLYENGRATAQDHSLALQWYQRASEKGDSRATANLGWMYLKATGVPKDSGRAVALFRRSAEMGNTFGMRSLGAVYADGEDVAKDAARALQLWHQAAELGDVDAMSTLGSVYQGGELVAANSALAASWYRRAAEKGDSDSMFRLAGFYESGVGVEKSLREAARLYLGAAQAGHVRAMGQIAWAYDHGEGVPQDMQEALKWYGLAVEKGDLFSMSALGTKYMKGEGVPPNHAEALRLYTRAAEGGSANAMNNVGYMYRYGLGMVSNPVQALAWFRKAADHGSEYGMFNLGCLYREGSGVGKDLKEARVWLTKAHEHGHPSAAEALKDLEGLKTLETFKNAKEKPAGANVIEGISQFWKKLTN